MKRYEFTIQSSARAGVDRRLGTIQIELDSDAADLLAEAFAGVYAQTAAPADMILLLALRETGIDVIHRRELADERRQSA